MRRARVRAEVTAADPLFRRNVESGSRENFFKLLNPLLRSLGDQAWRERRILEIDGMRPPGRVTVADLLNEVRTRAWLKFGDCPVQLPLDLWLMKRLHEVLEEWTTREPEMRGALHDWTVDVPQADVPQVDDREWWAWLLGADDWITFESSIPAAELRRSKCNLRLKS